MDEATRLRFAVLHLKAEMIAAGLDPAFATTKAIELANQVTVGEDGEPNDRAAMAPLVAGVTTDADPRWRTSEREFYEELRRSVAAQRGHQHVPKGADPYYAAIRKAAQKTQTPSGPSVEQRLGMTTED
jgi:hypothetical protein